MMWTRRELKERAKEALRRNYWKIVLVSSLMLLLGGGVGSVGIGRGNSRAESQEMEISQNQKQGEAIEQSGKALRLMLRGLERGREEVNISPVFITVATLVAVAIFLLIAVLAFMVVFVVDIFLINPFSVGVGRFMIKSMDDKAQVTEIAYGFDHSYKNVVRTLFHRDVRILLWVLVFIIPGIYKKYQYRMVSYIMAEHPDMDYRSALQMSSDMMNGHKWRAFVLDLSFVLWHFLGSITCGIVEILYVQPYHQLTYAALYRRLSGTDGNFSSPLRDRSLRNEDEYGI